MSNWVEKVIEEIEALYKYVTVGRPKKLEKIILSHAPVTDAQAVAEKIHDYVLAQVEPFTMGTAIYKETDNFDSDVAQLITDNMDLDITWVDSKADEKDRSIANYGRFVLLVQPGTGIIDNSLDSQLFQWLIGYDSEHKVLAANLIDTTQELAQQACEKALRRIITGR